MPQPKVGLSTERLPLAGFYLENFHWGGSGWEGEPGVAYPSRNPDFKLWAGMNVASKFYF